MNVLRLAPLTAGLRKQLAGSALDIRLGRNLERALNGVTVAAPVAGGFLSDPLKLYHAPETQTRIQAECRAEIKRRSGRPSTRSPFWSTLDVRLDSIVGWSQTISLAAIPQHAREHVAEWCVSRTFVKPEATEILAPPTRLLSFRARFSHTDGAWIIILETLAPGEAISDGSGHISAREGVCFFHRGHPGIAI